MTCSFISRHTSSRTISKRLGGCWPEEEADSNYSQHNGAAQYFHRIAAHADVGNALGFPGCSDIHFTWTTATRFPGESTPAHRSLRRRAGPSNWQRSRRLSLWQDLRRHRKTFALELQARLRAVRDRESRKSWRLYSL